jgi:hypothetical protein
VSELAIVWQNLPAYVAKMNSAQKVIREEAIATVNRCTALGRDRSRSHIHSITGKTAASVQAQPATFAGLAARDSWGTSLPSARWLEEGRGPVRAKNARALRFSIGGRTLFRVSVGPAAPRPFISRAFRELRGRFQSEFRIGRARIVARLGGRS